jgi:hypothetical protein
MNTSGSLSLACVPRGTNARCCKPPKWWQATVTKVSFLLLEELWGSTIVQDP